MTITPGVHINRKRNPRVSKSLINIIASILTQVKPRTESVCVDSDLLIYYNIYRVVNSNGTECRKGEELTRCEKGMQQS